MKKIIKVIALLTMTFGLIYNVDFSYAEEKEIIKIGAMPLNEEAVNELAKLVDDFTIETVVFDGNALPAQALSADEIDGLILNHKPWIEVFNEENNASLKLVDGFAYASQTGIYSSKYESIDEIPENGTIIISNDPSNKERALLFLEELGLIKLGEKSEEFYSIQDIEENPLNLSFPELETTMTAGLYEDADATVAFTSVMKQAGIDPQSYIAEDGKHVDYPTGLVVQEGDEDEEWVKAAIEALNSEEFEEAFNEIFEGAYVILDLE